jgi:hypothetical protein
MTIQARYLNTVNGLLIGEYLQKLFELNLH